MFADDGIHGPIDHLLRHLMQGTLAYVGYDVLEPFVGWHIPYLKPDDRERTMAAYIACLRSLDERKVLPMPSMDGFNSDMSPKRDGLLAATGS